MEKNNNKIGYARVSTDDQSLDMQINRLIKSGVHPDNIYSEHVSGSKRKRPALNDALRRLAPGDTFVVWKLDRVARSVAHLMEIFKDFEDRDITFESITEKIDTATPGGLLFFHLLAAFAQFERDLIQ